MLIDAYNLATELRENEVSLNPYSNGICSLTSYRSILPYIADKVLILILMEYAH